MVYDASRAWSFHVKDLLYQLSFEISAQDKTLFYWNRNSQLQGIIKVHVDDLLWGGTNEFENKIINRLRDTFLVGSYCTKLGKANYYDAQKANKVLKKLKLGTVALHLWRLEPPFELIMHSDVSYVNLEDGSS